MNADEARNIADKVAVLHILSQDIYNRIKEAASNGKYSITLNIEPGLSARTIMDLYSMLKRDGYKMCMTQKDDVKKININWDADA